MADRSQPLQIRALEFRYTSQSAATSFALTIPSLQMRAGEQVLLTGGSGRGKSTLLYLIAGLIDPFSGQIVVGGSDIHALQGGERDAFRGQHIGMIFQTFNLLHGFTAAQNVMAALMFSKIPGGEHRSRAEALLSQLGIAHPNADPDRMSVGQQQRIAVARAVACDPLLVLADEPTASLDPSLADSAMQLIQETCQKKKAALLCTSHDPAMKSRFDRHIDIEEFARSFASAEGARA